MQITTFILEKYKRLMLSNIQRFEYHPTRSMQLIIGSNGSGKSSVLEELTPLPAHHSGFVKGGSKIIHVSHRNFEYELKSVYNGGSGSHSFVRNGEELNQGGTFAIQEELVRQEFGLTRKIHELMIGLKTFTDMSTAERRHWLTLLSPVELGYAFNVYNKVKDHHRDKLGVIKHLTKRMGQENHDLADDSTLAQYRAEIKRGTDKLDRLFELRQAGLESAFRDNQDFEAQLRELTGRARRLLLQHLEIPTDPAVHRDNGLVELREQLHGKRTLLERMNDEHQRLLQQTPARDAELTDEQIAELRLQVETLVQQEYVYDKQVGDYTGAFPLVTLPLDRQPLELLTRTFEEWANLLQSTPLNEDGRFNSERAGLAQESLKTMEAQRQANDSRANALVGRIARLKGCETVQCPACEHTFKPGVDPNEVVKLERELRSLGEQNEAMEPKLAELKQYLEDFHDYLSYVRAFRGLVQGNPVFQPVWDYCLEQRVMSRNPRQFITAATQWRNGMELKLQLDLTRQEREILQHRLRYVEAIDRDALTQTDQRRKQLETEISQTTDEIRTLSQRIEALERWLQRGDGFKRQLVQVHEQLSAFLEKVEHQRQFLFQTAVAEETRQTHHRIAQTQENLSRAELQEGLLRDIQKQHDEALQTHQDLGLLVKALAPTGGLIGRYLMGFMQVVVKLLNAVIGEVWTYPMEVLPSQVEKEELDYKFPLKVNDGAVVAPDISRGSASQRDIVNFAFKLLARKFLGLDDHPLYLDEFGSTFDEQHRLNLIPFINRLLEMGQVNQLFYISHFDATHGAFNQAEICVLDPSNITVPQSYNQHVKIA